jgi:hypothetical protein
MSRYSGALVLQIQRQVRLGRQLGTEMDAGELDQPSMP